MIVKMSHPYYNQVEKIKKKPYDCESVATQKELYSIATDVYNLKVPVRASKYDLCKNITKHLGYDYDAEIEQQKLKKKQSQQSSLSSSLSSLSLSSSSNFNIKDNLRILLLGKEIMEECNKQGKIEEDNKIFISSPQ